MSVHYTDKISQLLAMDDMAGSSLLQSIRVWTNLIRQGCQDISLIWGAGNSLWQCGVLFGGFRATECWCVKGANGQRVWPLAAHTQRGLAKGAMLPLRKQILRCHREGCAMETWLSSFVHVFPLWNFLESDQHYEWGIFN